MRTVGIIGGLGPETTAEFYLDLVFSTYEQDKSQRPGIIISSVPLPYRIEEDIIKRNKGAERIRPFLIKEAKRLEESGVEFIVMPCNSLHVFIDDLRSAVNVPVLSIIEETLRFVQERNFSKVGIISTSATIKNRLYEDAFARAGIAFVAPDGLQQAKMDRIIHNLVMGRKDNLDRESIIDIVNSYEGKDVNCVLLACTDLQLLIPKHENLEIVDTMKLFADATVKAILG